MTRHKDSLAFIKYLQDTITKLTSPLEAMENEINGYSDVRFSIGAELLHIGKVFAYANKNVTESEAAFIIDVNNFLDFDDVDDFLDNWIEVFGNKFDYQNYIHESAAKFSSTSLADNLSIPEPVKFLQIYDERNGTDFATQAKSMLFRFANMVAKADGNVCEEEQILLSKYKDILLFDDALEETEEEDKSIASSSFEIGVTKSKSLDELTNELNSLVGLDRVKNDVAQLVNFLKVQQMREAKGMAVQPLSRHLVFYGNPGTGKTTVARLLSQIYKSLGILSEGQLVETDRAGLVAGYVGQTALKVREVVSEAVGGVLFIDEAYALSTGGDNDFGREAIDTLLKMMEDNRDDLIVVVAGYTDKMSAFVQTNPGLRSRFNKYLEFEDYTPGQLVEIFELFCTNGGYKLASSTHDDLIKLFSVLYETRDETFGNGRLARNLYEMTINNQANRIVSLPQVDDEILSSIEETDIPGMVDLQSIR